VLLFVGDAVVALRDVRFLIRSWNGHPIRTPHTCVTLASVLPCESEVALDRKIPAGRYLPTMATIASDASDTAIASYCIDGLPSFELFSFLTPHEMSYLSSQRRLLALYRTKGPVTLWWMTDNSNVSKFLSKGSGRLPIMLQILELLRLARAFSLDIRPIWVRSDHHWLQRADAMSKQIDTDSWSVWQILIF
jgi:hypothetical protein